MGAFIVTTVGRLLLATSIVLLGMELLRFVESGRYAPLSTIALWAILDIESLQALENAVTQGMFPGIWQGLLQPVMDIAALYMAVGIGSIALFLGKKTS
tara:strand:+ start:2371 stop:2667 length:297 start_codon:yes stop_codon:yes gene_type:complete